MDKLQHNNISFHLHIHVKKHNHADTRQTEEEKQEAKVNSHKVSRLANMYTIWSKQQKLIWHMKSRHVYVQIVKSFLSSRYLNFSFHCQKINFNIFHIPCRGTEDIYQNANHTATDTTVYYGSEHVKNYSHSVQSRNYDAQRNTDLYRGLLGFDTIV